MTGQRRPLLGRPRQDAVERVPHRGDLGQQLDPAVGQLRHLAAGRGPQLLGLPAGVRTDVGGLPLGRVPQRGRVPVGVLAHLVGLGLGQPQHLGDPLAERVEARPSALELGADAGQLGGRRRRSRAADTGQLGAAAGRRARRPWRGARPPGAGRSRAAPRRNRRGHPDGCGRGAGAGVLHHGDHAGTRSSPDDGTNVTGARSSVIVGPFLRRLSGAPGRHASAPPLGSVLPTGRARQTGPAPPGRVTVAGMTGMRFGMDIAQQRMEWDDLLGRVRLGEDLGFDGVWGFDHFVPMYGEGPGNCFEGMTTLAALASATSRIRLGLLVTGVTYRHPSVLAAQAVTVDHASHGRLELAMGAAWYEAEHRQLGIDFPPLGRAVRPARGLPGDPHPAVHRRGRRLRRARVQPGTGRGCARPRSSSRTRRCGSAGPGAGAPCRWWPGTRTSGTASSRPRASASCPPWWTSWPPRPAGTRPRSPGRPRCRCPSRGTRSARTPRRCARPASAYLVCGWPAEGAARVEEFVTRGPARPGRLTGTCQEPVDRTREAEPPADVPGRAAVVPARRFRSGCWPARCRRWRARLHPAGRALALAGELLPVQRAVDPLGVPVVGGAAVRRAVRRRGGAAARRSDRPGLGRRRAVALSGVGLVESFWFAFQVLQGDGATRVLPFARGYAVVLALALVLTWASVLLSQEAGTRVSRCSRPG